MTRPQIFFYVQHLLGIGHFRRATLLAQAMERAGLAVTFVSGGHPVAGIEAGASRYIQLPPAESEDSSFSKILDEDGKPIDDRWRERRRAALLAAWDQTQPDLLLIEQFPFGRRAFRFELLPLLAAAAQARPRLKVACSLRDILVAKPDAKRNGEMLELARRHFDAVLVHGDPRLVRLEESFPPAAALGDLLRYTGYVAAKLESRAAAHGEVAVSAGGGAVGMGLLSAALAARGLSPLADAPWRLIAGPGLPETDYRHLADGLPPGVALERFRADFPHYLSGARFSISQAGYNTVMDLLQAQIPAVVVPFAEAAETEQSLRAHILAKRGLLGVVEAIDLTPASLARAIDRRLVDADRRAESPSPVAVDGADRSAAILKEMIGR